jgi:hypothetical protein
MSDTPEHLAERLKEEGEKVSRFYRELSPQQWGVGVYTEGSCWTARQILVHFDVTETNIAWLIKDILSGGKGAPENFNLDEFNERTVAARKDLNTDDLLDRFADHRRETVDLVRNMSTQELGMSGRHPYLGVAPLMEIIKLMYLHNQIHLRDIRRVLTQKV